MNTLPVEILEKIINGKYWSYRKYSWAYDHHILKNNALVCRTWGLIVNPILWKEVNLRGAYDDQYLGGDEFRFYRHITKPGYICGKYIQKLVINYSRLWPICIIKILRACPNIVDLTIRKYEYYDMKGRGKVNNFLEQIQVLLPKLRKLNLEYSHKVITGIEKLIKDRKDLEILVTRKNKSNSNFIDKYDGKEWIKKFN
jgi:F-box-like